MSTEGTSKSTGQALTQEDVFFLVGVAHGPYLSGLTELPVALLEIAGKISASIGDHTMMKRCREMVEQIAPTQPTKD